MKLSCRWLVLQSPEDSTKQSAAFVQHGTSLIYTDFNLSNLDESLEETLDDLASENGYNYLTYMDSELDGVFVDIYATSEDFYSVKFEPEAFPRILSNLKSDIEVLPTKELELESYRRFGKFPALITFDFGDGSVPDYLKSVTLVFYIDKKLIGGT